MISVTSMRVRNLRSLGDTGFIELKPITILVGRNSSGKSTFARVLPLLRQSDEAVKRGPILWWGRLVDFGSFDESINRDAKDESIGLDFKLQFEPGDLSTRTRRGLGRVSFLRTLESGSLDVELDFRKSGSECYTSSITIRVFDFTCVISLDEHGWVRSILCGDYSWKPAGAIAGYATQDRLVPIPSFYIQRDQREGQTSINWESHDPFNVELQRVIRPFVHGNTTDDRVRQLANKIPLGSRQRVFDTLRAIANPPSFRESLGSRGPDNSSFTRMRDISFVSQIDMLVEQINSALSAFSSELIYLEPLRATAQRYYRQQSLAVGEIDSKGENIAMFLDSLSPFNLANFQAWTSKHFDFSVAPTKEGGHISIAIQQGDSPVRTNLADMGFGFSQLLPIAAQMWAASGGRALFFPNKRTSGPPTIVIEQPELHLHPDYQAKMADVFTAAIAGNDTSDQPSSPRSGLGVRIVAETHSPNLINRLGALIADGVLDKDKVQVIVFDQDSSQSNTNIRIANYDSEGILTNWPLGFFDPRLSH